MAPTSSDTPILSGVLRGMLPMFLLTLLDKSALYGSELMAAFARMSGGAWQPSPGSLYPLLRRLEAEGKIAGQWRSGKAAAKRVYEITARGREELPAVQGRLLGELQRARALIDTHIEVLERLMGGADAGSFFPAHIPDDAPEAPDAGAPARVTASSVAPGADAKSPDSTSRRRRGRRSR